MPLNRVFYFIFFYLITTKNKEALMDGSMIIVAILILLYILDSWNVTSFSKSDKKDYIQSAAWQLKRQQILKRDNHKCVVCFSKDRLEIHHISYRHLGNEPLKDLVTVCRTCHQNTHDRSGYGYQKQHPVNIQK